MVLNIPSPLLPFITRYLKGLCIFELLYVNRVLRNRLFSTGYQELDLTSVELFCCCKFCDFSKCSKYAYCVRKPYIPSLYSQCQSLNTLIINSVKAAEQMVWISKIPTNLTSLTFRYQLGSLSESIDFSRLVKLKNLSCPFKILEPSVLPLSLESLDTQFNSLLITPPENLKHLTVFELTREYTIPTNLVSLKFHGFLDLFDSFPLIQIPIEILPKSLTALKLSDRYNLKFEPMSKYSLEHLLPNLTTLNLDCSNIEGQIVSFPPLLRTLSYNVERKMKYLVNWPPLPPTLTSLVAPDAMVGLETISKIPNSVTKLSILLLIEEESHSPKEFLEAFKIHFVNLIDFKTMSNKLEYCLDLIFPENIRKLQLPTYDFNRSVTSLTMLQTLKLNGFNLMDVQISYLPRQLQTFIIFNANKLTDLCVPELPPQLLSLKFFQSRLFTTRCFKDLPRTLTNLTLMNVYRSDESDFDQLPQNLKILKINNNLTITDIQKLPKSLIRISANFEEDPETVIENLPLSIQMESQEDRLIFNSVYRGSKI